MRLFPSSPHHGPPGGGVTFYPKREVVCSLSLVKTTLWKKLTTGSRAQVFFTGSAQETVLQRPKIIQESCMP